MKNCRMVIKRFVPDAEICLVVALLVVDEVLVLVPPLNDRHLPPRWYALMAVVLIAPWPRYAAHGSLCAGPFWILLS